MPLDGDWARYTADIEVNDADRPWVHPTWRRIKRLLPSLCGKQRS